MAEEQGGQDLEFSMIDQEDYPSIDAYIKAHKLNDESMAEQRAAKTFNVNGKVDQDGAGDGSGELEKAWNEVAEEDEEDEEDYVPEGEISFTNPADREVSNRVVNMSSNYLVVNKSITS